MVFHSIEFVYFLLVLEAQEYQIRQLQKRKINEIDASKRVWAEKAAAVYVVEMDEIVRSYYMRDMEEAYVENDQRMAAARAKIAEGHSKREIESFLAMEEFIAACTQANYNVADITAMKPERAAFALRSLMNEWLKNGVVEPKDEQVKVVEVPTPISRLKKAIKTKQAAPTTQVIEDQPTVVLTPETPQNTAPQPDSYVPLTAGARAFAELGPQPEIEAIEVAALGGKVVERFAIDKNRGAR